MRPRTYDAARASNASRRRQKDPVAEAHPSARHQAAMRYAAFGAILVALLCVAAAWRWTPLSEYLDPASLLERVRALRELPFAPVLVLLGYVVGSLCVVPITLLVIVTGMAFDAGPAIAYALAGILLSSAVTFLLGAWLGRNAVRRFAGARINAISRRVARGGIPAVALMRLFPFAPFTVVNLVAGASHIRLRDFLIGTMVGEGPGTILMILFVNQLAGAIREPSLGAFSAALAALIALVWLGFVLKRKFGSAGRKHGA
jgi:phospholipase D1/2